MELEFIPGQYSVCKIAAPGPEILFYTAQPYCFIGKTDEEFSLVCQTEIAPEDTADREDGWCAFRITGTLDFSLIGILAPIADILAENKIGILALSTFNTDYVFIKEENKGKAVSVLTAAGYRFR